MFDFMGTSFKRNQQPTSRQAAVRRGRLLCLEELESRSLPSAVTVQMAFVKADVQAIMIPGGSFTVRMDISHLAKDVNTINADLAAGRDATADVNTAIAADNLLANDIAASGIKFAPFVTNAVADIHTRLEIVATDLKTP
jgi:hypothetical protein